MFDRCAAELGPVDAFVSNAGIIHKAAPLADIPVAEIRRIVEVDLTAHLICCREAVRRMSTKRGGQGGAIVLMSSMASELYGAGGFLPYGAAKGGIDVLTMGLGKEVAAEGIRVTGLRPGLIDTEIQEETGIENRLARFGPTVPIGRAGSADEVAEAALWLLSDQGLLRHRPPCSTFPAAADRERRMAMDEYLERGGDPARRRLQRASWSAGSGCRAIRPGRQWWRSVTTACST